MSVKVVGVMTVTILVTPAAAACGPRTCRPVMLLTGFFGALAGTLGLYAAYHMPIAPAAVVGVVLGGLFVVSALVAPRGPRRRRLHAPGQAHGDSSRRARTGRDRSRN